MRLEVSGRTAVLLKGDASRIFVKDQIIMSRGASMLSTLSFILHLYYFFKIYLPYFFASKETSTIGQIF